MLNTRDIDPTRFPCHQGHRSDHQSGRSHGNLDPYIASMTTSARHCELPRCRPRSQQPRPGHQEMVENTEPPPELFNHCEKGEQNQPNEERGRVEAMDKQGKRNSNSNDRAVPAELSNSAGGEAWTDRSRSVLSASVPSIHIISLFASAAMPNNCSPSFSALLVPKHTLVELLQS